MAEASAVTMTTHSSRSKAKVRNSEQVSGGGGDAGCNDDRFFKMATEKFVQRKGTAMTTTKTNKCSARTMKCKRGGATKPHSS